MENYHIYEEVGRGRHSVVYKSRRKKTLQYVAVKSVDKSQKSFILNEVRIMHAMNHRSVLKFVNWYETRNHIWLILEYCSGGTLRDLLTQDKQLPLESIRVFAQDLISGLSYLWKQGTILSDLKPSALLLDGSGFIKISDFSIAFRVQPGQTLPLFSNSRGTPCYMAPELFSDPPTTPTIQSDEWSLGCILYEMAAGRPPFVSENINDLIKLVVSEHYIRIPSVSREFEHLVAGLLQKSPGDRLQWDQLENHPFLSGKSTSDTVLVPISISEKQHDGANTPEKATDENRPEEKDVKGTDSKISDTEAKLKAGLAVAERVLRAQEVERQRSSSAHKYRLARRTSSSVDLAATVEKNDTQTNPNTPTIHKSYPPPYETMTLFPINRNEIDTEEELEGDDDGETIADDVEEDTPESDGETETEEIKTEDGKTAKTDLRELTLPRAPPKPQPAPQHPGKIRQSERESAHTGLPLRMIGEKLGLGGPKAMDSPRVHPIDAPPSSNARSVRPESAPPSRVRIPGAINTPRIMEGSPRKNASAMRPTSAQPLGRRTGETHTLTTGTATTATRHTFTELMEAAFKHMWHDSDSMIRPVVANRNIEKLKTAPVDTRALPFKAYSVEEFTEKLKTGIEEFLTEILKGVTSAKKPSVVHNILSYCTKLAVNADIANTFINSTLMNQFVTILRTDRNVSTRARLAHLIGVLLRTATFVREGFHKTGIVPALADLLRERNEKLRRRGTAALGELLFYVATQQESHLNSDSSKQSSMPWSSVSASTAMKPLIRCLRSDEDSTVKHYATQALYNIAASTKEWANELASAETCVALWRLQEGSKIEMMRSTATATMVRLCNISRSLVSVLVDRMGSSALLGGLSDEKSALVQQAFTTLLIIGGAYDSPSRFLSTLLNIARPVSSALVAMLDSTSSAMRGKSLLAIAVLCSRHPGWLSSFCDVKLVPRLEKILQHSDSYVEQCGAVLKLSLSEIVPWILQAVAIEISRIGNRSRPPVSALRQLKEYLAYTPAVMQCLAGHSLRRALVTDGFVQHLGIALEYVEFEALVPAEYRRVILLITEAITQKAGLLRSHSNSTLQFLLPALAGLLRSESGDTRFWCLKMLLDCVQGFMRESEHYDISAKSGPVVQSTKRLNEVIITMILQRYNKLLCDRDPIPLFSIKLLNTILENNRGFGVIIYRLRLFPALFQLFAAPEQGGRPSVHIVRLISSLIGSPDIDAGYCFEQGLIHRLVSVLQYAARGHESDSDSWIEYLLDTILTVLGHTAARVHSLRNEKQIDGRDSVEKLKSAKSEILGRTSALLDLLPIFVELLSHDDASIAESAAKTLNLLLLTYDTAPEKIASEPEYVSALSRALTNAGGDSRRGVAVENLRLYTIKIVAQVLRTGARPRESMTSLNISDVDTERIADAWAGLEEGLSRLCSDGSSEVASAAQTAVLLL